MLCVAIWLLSVWPNLLPQLSPQHPSSRSPLGLMVMFHLCFLSILIVNMLSLWRIVILNWGRLWPPTQGTVSKVWRHFWFSLLEGCYWHLVSRGQRCCLTYCSSQKSLLPSSPQQWLILSRCQWYWDWEILMWNKYTLLLYLVHEISLNVIHLIHALQRLPVFISCTTCMML